MIRLFLNSTITLMLAKFMMNDVPHAAGIIGDRYQQDPTPGQLRYIAALCQQLKITTLHEEQVKTFGEAGTMIRELEAEKAYRRVNRHDKR